MTSDNKIHISEEKHFSQNLSFSHGTLTKCTQKLQKHVFSRSFDHFSKLRCPIFSSNKPQNPENQQTLIQNRPKVDQIKILIDFLSISDPPEPQKP